jgi:hypothetical protein
MIYLFDYGFGASEVYDANSISEDERLFAVKIENVPEPEVIEGKVAILRCDHQTKKVWYDYVDYSQ